MDNELLQAVSNLKSVYAESVAAGQLSVFGASTSADVDSVSAEALGKALSGQLVSAAGAVAGAGICSAIGAAALAPACAAAGAWVAEKVAIVVEDIGKSLSGIFNAKGGGEPGDEGYAVFSPDWKALDAKRNAILKALSLSGDDPITVDAIKRLAYTVCPTELMLKALGPLVMTQPMGAGYASFLVVPPFYVAPQAFEPYPQGNTKSVIAFTYNGALAWDDSIIRGLVEPLIKGGLPLKWLFGELISEHISKHAGHPSGEYFAIRDAVAQKVVPELDKYVAARLKWILEEGALRRNLRATQASKEIALRLRKLHPDWSDKKIKETRARIVSAIESGDSAVIAAEVESVVPSPKVEAPSSGGESQQEPKAKKGGGAAIGIAVAIAVALVVAMRR